MLLSFSSIKIALCLILVSFNQGLLPIIHHPTYPTDARLLALAYAFAHIPRPLDTYRLSQQDAARRAFWVTEDYWYLLRLPFVSYLLLQTVSGAV